MFARLLIGCLLAAICIQGVSNAQEKEDPFGVPGPGGDDPFATERGAPKAVEKSPFWEAEPLKFEKLKKIDVRLVETPNEAIDFAVIQIGESNPANYLDDGKPSNVSAFLEKATIPYAIGDEPLKVGSKVYRDRKYVIQEIPEILRGLTHLQTRAAHKAIVDSRYSIVLSTEKPTWVFLAIDERAFSNYSSLGTPGWFKEYSPTELKIVTDDPIMAGYSAYKVFAKKVAPGKFVLGAPALEVRRHSMYFAFFAEAE